MGVLGSHLQVSGEGLPRLIIERKSWADFVSSLRDGRYSSQKARLLAERERAHASGTDLRVVYLIEASRVPSYEDKTQGMPNNQPYAALIKVSF